MLAFVCRSHLCRDLVTGSVLVLLVAPAVANVFLIETLEWLVSNDSFTLRSSRHWRSANGRSSTFVQILLAAHISRLPTKSDTACQLALRLLQLNANQTA